MSKLVPNVQIRFNEKFTESFDNRVLHWGFFTREEIEQNKGKLLMLDIDFGRYCSLECPGCFRKSNTIDDFRDGDLAYDELIQVIDDASKIGLRSVKICGAGEPTENSKFLQFVREMTERDIGVACFTKGQVLGSDENTRKFNKKYSICSAQQLCDELAEYKISIMLSFQSFYTEKQDALVGNAEGHSIIRNKALENLVKSRFNQTNPTRLAVVNAPLDKSVYDEAFEIYVWARRRNIFPVIAMHMVSGKKIDKYFLRAHDITDEQKKELWRKIYSWNISNGVQTEEQLRLEGISCMPGIHPCNQLACGLYVSANGNVVRCPGYNSPILGNVKEDSIKRIWEREGREFEGKFNHCCPPKDGLTIPLEIYCGV